MDVTGERYQARAVVTYPDGMVPSKEHYWSTAKLNLGSAPPSPDGIEYVLEKCDLLEEHYRNIGFDFTVHEPVIYHQEQHAHRILGLPFRTWHTVEVIPLPIPETI